MTRFSETFQSLRSRGACGLFPYLTAGFPNVPTSQALAQAALQAGVDGFEIGVPFSDPLADGATLQRVNSRALANGGSLRAALDLASSIRAASATTPVVLMSYYNPVCQYGDERFADGLAAAGADGAIIPDMPHEEAAHLRQALRGRGLNLIPMLAPTSSDERVRAAASLGPAFIYCVALVGVTGARQDLSDTLGDFLARVRQQTDAALVVGFGIAQPEHVRRAARLGADGVIVASALADLVERSGEPVPAAREYLRSMKAAAEPHPSLPS